MANVAISNTITAQVDLSRLVISLVVFLGFFIAIAWLTRSRRK